MLECYLVEPFQDPKERRAFARLATILAHYPNAPYMALVGNIPESANLSQVDAFLFVENRFVSLIEFKSNYDVPVLASVNPQKPWYLGDPITHLPTHKKVLSGSRKNRNPYEQVNKARVQWKNFFRERSATFVAQAKIPPNRLTGLQRAWENQLKGWILFHPSLHNNSTIPVALADRSWFTVRGMDEISMLLAETISSLRLSALEIRHYLLHGLDATRWNEMEKSIAGKPVIGDLCVRDFDTSLEQLFPVHRFDTITVGRHASNQIQIQNGRTSRFHVRLEWGLLDEMVVYDLGSSHGTYLNGVRISEDSGTVVTAGTAICLGDTAPDCTLRFEWRSIHPDDFYEGTQ